MAALKILRDGHIKKQVHQEKNESLDYLSEKVKDGKVISFDKGNAMSQFFLVTSVEWEEPDCLDIL